MITLVYAQDLAGGIGYQNQLPWSLPNDLKFFKEVTWGKTIVMGRKTFESMDCRLLPGRKTIVITSQNDYGQDIEGLTVMHSVTELIENCGSEELMVIGGAELFSAVIPYADQIIRTQIFETFTTDVKVEPIDENQWELIREQQGEVDHRNLYQHQYQWWQRKEREE